MISEKLGKQLHHKFSLGQPLTSIEKKQLKDWYNDQDNQEMTAIQMPQTTVSFPNIQARIEATLTQLVELTHRIQQITLDNEQLRKQNRLLLKQLPTFRSSTK
ncbi:MAG: hypothetical protein ACPGVB_05820 [Chitinophagales bacterium]